MEPFPVTRRVAWKDLVRLSRKETFIENTITLPWLAASWYLAFRGKYVAALPCSFVFFLTAFRQVHNGFHYTLGISKKATWVSLYVNSLLMMAATHAVKFTHLRHHKHCMTEKDHEGSCARMKWYRALAYGPVHIFRTHQLALREGSASCRRYVRLELVSIAVLLFITCLTGNGLMIYHSVTMLTGEMLAAFFAVWTVHHDLADEEVARTQRGSWKNRISYNMFYHLEHHLFPAVPTIKLPELAKRLDASVPELPKKHVF